ncbi:alpha/beta-hydrolase [Gymnopus androsaceus JB14]|uniref:Alpha/beta-hydrolase n=1 Tax=Gymnopus androsaceus JB14 TaxID=1447944 RepID=A0A6A4HSS3_9AGAR|nr:alpha/beta-hydrolase [Gymnopus androsaceus JB14]
MDLADRLPECLDSMQYSYQQQTLASKTDAMRKCVYMIDEVWESRFSDHDPYDYRTKCPPEGCSLGLDPLSDVLNSTVLKDTVGVSRESEFKVLALEDIGMPFMDNGDMIQAAHLLLAPAIEDGMRLFVYNGMQDGVCPWRSSFAWMRLLETKYQSGFRDALEIDYPGVGSIRQVGPGAGNYTFIKVKDAGHMVILSQPELLRHFMVQWVTNQPFF